MNEHGTGERGLFAFRDGEFVRIKEPKKQRKAPDIITDDMEPLQSYATPDAPVFTSKSALRRHYRENGFRETGGEHLKDSKERAKTASEREREAREDRELVEAAYMDVKYGRVPFSEQEKENHKREEQEWGRHYKVKPPI